VTEWAGLTALSILRVNILMVYKHANSNTTNYSLDLLQHNTMANVKKNYAKTRLGKIKHVWWG